MTEFLEAKPFFMPLEIEKAWEINEHVIAYWVYWEPCGDECVVGRLYRNGLIEESDSDWQAYLKLENLNPIMQLHELGNSEEEAKEVLFCDKIHGKFYFIPRTKLREVLEKCIS